MAHKQLIIPIFIPFGGCPHQCVFCDQKQITGNSRLPSIEEVTSTIDVYLSTWKGKGPKEAAFYGGSFTGLPVELQKRYLAAAFHYVSAGLLDSLRVSTRPDYISGEIISFISGYGVKTVELGVQSMDDRVLTLSERGHSASDTKRAVSILKSAGIKVGLQFMPGLPGDTRATVLHTVEEIIKLAPDFVRVYPSLVLKDTELHRMYISGHYAPWTLEEMTEVCAEAKKMLQSAGIPIIRMGLQPTAELEKSLVAGPFHPSFRQLVEALS